MKKNFAIALMSVLLFAHCAKKPLTIPLDQYKDIVATVGGIGDVRHVEVKGKTAYASSTTGLHVVDFTDFENVKKLNSVPEKVDAFTMIDDATAATIAVGGQVKFMNVQNPTQIIVTTVTNEVCAGPFVAIAYASNTLALACGAQGLYLYNVTLPETLELKATIKAADVASYNSVSMDDNHVFASVVKNGKLVVQAIDYRTTEPAVVAEYVTKADPSNTLATPGNYVLQTQVQGDYVWITDGAQLSGWDITSNTIKKTYALQAQAVGLYHYDEYAVVGFTGDIEAYGYYKDIKLNLHAVLTSKGQARDGVYTDKEIVVADGTEGLKIVNIDKLIKKVQELMGNISIPSNK